MPTLLVADDDADHREMLTLILRRCGYDVIPTADAAAAASALRAGGVDAALLDLRMPGESGIDLCRRMRAEPGTRLLPVLLISAMADDRQVLAALSAGADDYLTKPFSRDELRARLDALLLDGSGAIRAQARAATAAAMSARPASHRTPVGHPA
ncbi:MAG: response regulator transcription factor [Actinoplanes sp.]